MLKSIQIRDIPEQLHNILKARAACEGMSLSDFIKRELECMAKGPSIQEWLEGSAQAKPIPAQRSAVQIVRELRDAR